jgi:hypothetical protein
MAHRAESVFVDASGRRRRLIRRMGLAVAALLMGYLVVVGVGLFVGADVPLTPWPGRGGNPGQGVGAELGRQGNGTPRPTAHPTTTTPSTSPSATARPGGTTPTRTDRTSAAATSPARSSRAATAPGHTKSPNPHKPR